MGFFNLFFMDCSCIQELRHRDNSFFIFLFYFYFSIMEMMDAALCSRCLEPNLVTVIPFWNLYLLGRYHLVQEIIHIHRQA